MSRNGPRTRLNEFANNLDTDLMRVWNLAANESGTVDNGKHTTEWARVASLLSQARSIARRFMHADDLKKTF